MGSYITPSGFRRLQEEADRLWRVERPRVTREVSAAAAQGDRSENAEYIYGKKQLREIDRRIRFLQKRLDELAEKNSAGLLTSKEEAVYPAYVEALDVIAILQAKARNALKSAGRSR